MVLDLVQVIVNDTDQYSWQVLDRDPGPVVLDSVVALALQMEAGLVGMSSDQTAVVARMAVARDEGDAAGTVAAVGAEVVARPPGTVAPRDSHSEAVDCTGFADPRAFAGRKEGLG